MGTDAKVATEEKLKKLLDEIREHEFRNPEDKEKLMKQMLILSDITNSFKRLQALIDYLGERIEPTEVK